jgi:hypothetical protein
MGPRVPGAKSYSLTSYLAQPLLRFLADRYQADNRFVVDSTLYLIHQSVPGRTLKLYMAPTRKADILEEEEDEVRR